MLPGLAAMSSGAGMLISLATYPGGRASDNPNQGHGLYTKALLDNLKRPGLSINQIFNEVAEQVSRESNGAQIPWTGSALRGITPFSGTRLLADTAAKTLPTANTGTFPRSADSFQGQIVAAPAPQVVLPPNFLTTPNVVRTQSRGMSSPEDENTLSDIAAQVRKGDVQQAERGLNMLAGQDPTDFHVALYSGQIALGKGQYQDAVNAFNIAIQEAPLNPLPLYLRALTYTLLGQYQAASSDINAALNDRPNDPLFSMAKANVMFVTGNYAAAIAICNQVIVGDSSAAPAYLIRGNSERLLGNATAANADYLTAAKLQSLE
jgi:tetratricopeptide (TPR) repeat protein